MTVEINFIPESVLLCYNHHANPQLTRAYTLIAIISHSIARLKSSPQKTPVCMLLLYLTPTHLNPQPPHKTGFTNGSVDCLFTEWVERDDEEEENPPWRRMAESIIHIHFFPIVMPLAFSVLFMPLTPPPPAHFCLFSIPHSKCYLSCLPSSPYCCCRYLTPPKALMLYTIQQPWEEVIVRQTRTNEASIATTIVNEQKCGKNQGVWTL